MPVGVTSFDGADGFTGPDVVYRGDGERVGHACSQVVEHRTLGPIRAVQEIVGDRADALSAGRRDHRVRELQAAIVDCLRRRLPVDGCGAVAGRCGDIRGRRRCNAGRADRSDRYRNTTIDGGSVTELTQMIAAPTLDRTRVQQRTDVVAVFACESHDAAERSRSRMVLDDDRNTRAVVAEPRRRIGDHTTVAEDPEQIGTPTTRPAGGEIRARRVARGDDAGNVVHHSGCSLYVRRQQPIGVGAVVADLAQRIPTPALRQPARHQRARVVITGADLDDAGQWTVAGRILDREGRVSACGPRTSSQLTVAS